MDMPKESQAAFITCTFAMLGKIASADGGVSEHEVRRVEKYLDQELKLDKKLRALAVQVFQESFTSPLELTDYAERFQKTFPDRLRHLDRLVEILIEVSLSDGKLEQREEELIYSAALALGLSKPAYERIKSKHQVSESSKLPN